MSVLCWLRKPPRLQDRPHIWGTGTHRCSLGIEGAERCVHTWRATSRDQWLHSFLFLPAGLLRGVLVPGSLPPYKAEATLCQHAGTIRRLGLRQRSTQLPKRHHLEAQEPRALKHGQRTWLVSPTKRLPLPAWPLPFTAHGILSSAWHRIPPRPTRATSQVV